MTDETEPIDLGRGQHFSISTLAAEFGTSRETLRRTLDRENVQPSGKNKGHDVFRLRDAIRAWLHSPESGFDPDKLPPAQRQQHYRAEHERTLHLERSGQLCSALAVEQRLGGAFKSIVQTLDNVPDTLERDCGATPAMVASVQALIDRLREDLHAKLIANGNGDTESSAAVS